jgi:hypothetical protein
MIAYCQDMYRSLSEELLQWPHPLQEEIEACFGSCYRYWSLVSAKAMNYPFSGLAEEIEFFKKIKPLFVAQMDYYQLLYHALLFQPETTPELLQSFWQRESQRLPDFIQDHHSFYFYYTTGGTWQDADLFTRRPATGLTEEPHSASDHLVSRLLALQRYADHLQENNNIL